jgi:fluoroquinolone transport system ATP-binding protein
MKVIDVEQLDYAYPNSERRAVRDLSFAVAQGEIFGFLGPSGAGKSTTQKVLIGLLRDYRGHVAVLGRDLKSWRNDYYTRIGVSFELPNHYLKLTAVENLKLFAALYPGPTQAPLDLLRLVDLEDDAHTRVANFSKGMQMRLNFARALLHQPELLFLDEPTAGLDPVNARRIKEIIMTLKQQGCTVFLTTHDMHVADELCDRVAFLVDGAIALIDSPRNLILRFGQSRVRVEVQSNGGSVTQEYPLANLGQNQEFLALIYSHPVETIHSQEATLEDIFIGVTGKRLA